MDLVGKRRWFFLASLIIIGAGILSMLIPPGFRIGIEFTGGSALMVTYDGLVAQDDVRSIVAQQGHDEAVIQRLHPWTHRV